MPADPRLKSALALAAAIGRLRAAEDWSVQNVAAAEDADDDAAAFYLTVTLRFEKSVEGEDLSRHIL